MSFRIFLQSRHLEFCCDEQQTILQAAIEANILMPHGCRAGQCGRCKQRVIEGSYCYAADAYDALDENDMIRGRLLCCQARPTSDMIIEAP